MNIFLKMLFAVVVALVSPLAAFGEGEVLTIVLVPTSVEDIENLKIKKSRPVNTLPSHISPRMYERLERMSDCVILPGGSVSTTKTLRGSSGLTEISYSLLSSDKEVPEPVCLGVMHVLRTSVVYETDTYNPDAFLRVMRGIISDDIVFWWTPIPTSSKAGFGTDVSGSKKNEVYIFGFDNYDFF